MTDSAAVLTRVCEALSAGNTTDAASTLSDSYPFTPIEKSQRSYSERQMTNIFVRDGFIDRYRGTRLIFPPTLRCISDALPQQFPYHRNWKMSETHVAYWELTPTIDHIQPLAAGGVDQESNWVSCSMLTNSIKANWTLGQLGWELLPPGKLSQWDGLSGWFVHQMDKHPASLENSPYYRRWYSAAKAYAV